MCGRFANIEKFDQLRAYYDAVANNEEWEANYNLAPMQMAPVVVEGEQGREIRLMKWGLVPHWAEDKKIGASLINARSETVAKLPSFRDSFKTRRCIVPASGFYEWKKIGKERHPHYFTPADGLFSFCGLWSKWKSPEGETLETFTILTTTANDVVMPIHDRMPVALGHLVSKCSEPTQARTREWLKHHRFFEQTGISTGNLHFCLERQEKAIICKDLKITHFIDDRLEVLSYLIDITPHLYLFSPNSSEMSEYKKHLRKVRQVESWLELDKILAKKK